MTTASIVSALRDPAGPPRTVGELATRLGITLDAAVLAAGRLGILEVAPSGSLVTRLRAEYGWSPFGAPVATLEALRERELLAWTASPRSGGGELEQALRELHGAPYEVASRKVFERWVLAPGDAGSVELSFHATLPDWAIPPPDAAVRARVLRELAAAVAAVSPEDAPRSTGAVARVLDGLPADGGITHDATKRKRSGFSIGFVPAIAATELVRIFGWQNAVGQCRAMHLTDWAIWLAVGRNELGGTRAVRPAFGPWEVVAELERRPTGGDVDAGARATPMGGTHALAPADPVRVLRVLLDIARR